MTFASTLILGFQLVVAGPGADPETAQPPSSPAPQHPRTEEGQALFQEGVAAYDAHDYSRAIDRFRAAYRVANAPEILFDIGQAYRAMGDCRQAFDHFNAFM